jgi:site-specific recombinase XerD
MDLIDRYLEHLVHNKGRSERTAAKYRLTLERLQAFLAQASTGLLEATQQQLDAFTGIHAHSELKLSPRARRPLVSAVRGFYGWALRVGLTKDNQAQAIETPLAGKPLPVAMSLQHAERLLMRCDMETFVGVRDAAMLAVLLGCGPRISGLCALNEGDLLWRLDDQRRERLIIRFSEKANKERLVPAPAETAMLLHAYLGHAELEGIDRTLPNGDRVLFASTKNRTVPPHEYHGEARRVRPLNVLRRIKRYGEQAGIPADELHPHALRHLFGTELTESDVHLLVQQDLMGHEDPSSTQIYTQLALRKKTQAIDQASPMRKIRSPVSDLVRRLDQD